MFGPANLNAQSTNLELGSKYALLPFLVWLTTFTRVRGWDEKNLYFYEPLDLFLTIHSDPKVSSVHFDLVGALASAASFSVTDAPTTHVYSQLPGSNVMTGANRVHSFMASPLPAAFPSPDWPPVHTVPPPPRPRRQWLWGSPT